MSGTNCKNAVPAFDNPVFTTVSEERSDSSTFLRKSSPDMSSKKRDQALDSSYQDLLSYDHLYQKLQKDRLSPLTSSRSHLGGILEPDLVLENDNNQDFVTTRLKCYAKYEEPTDSSKSFRDQLNRSESRQRENTEDSGTPQKTDLHSYLELVDGHDLIRANGSKRAEFPLYFELENSFTTSEGSAVISRKSSRQPEVATPQHAKHTRHVRHDHEQQSTRQTPYYFVLEKSDDTSANNARRIGEKRAKQQSEIKKFPTDESSSNRDDEVKLSRRFLAVLLLVLLLSLSFAVVTFCLVGLMLQGTLGDDCSCRDSGESCLLLL